MLSSDYWLSIFLSRVLSSITVLVVRCLHPIALRVKHLLMRCRLAQLNPSRDELIQVQTPLPIPSADLCTRA